MAIYLVTGGCGFIGSHLCRGLTQLGHHVRVLDDFSTGSLANVPEGVEIVRGCVTDPKTVKAVMTGLSGCFHLAAVASVERSIDDWLGSHRTNVSGTITVFECIRKLGYSRVPVVYASSAAVYGDCKQLPVGETAPIRPTSPYGVDKYGSELHARIATEVHRIPTIGLRLFNVYGPGQDPRSPYSGVISIFCERLLRAQPIEIFGDGSQTRDFVFVADVVTSLIAAMRRAEESSTPMCAIYNVCTGTKTTVLDLARLLADLCNYSPEILFRPARSGEIAHSFGTRSLITRELNLPEPVKLASGLSCTVSWMRASVAERGPIVG